MNDRKDTIDNDSLFWGLMLMGLGTMFLLDRLGIVDHVNIGSYWPLFIIASGVSRLFNRRRVWSGVWLIAVGAWMQATTLHLYGLNWGTSWPLFLIMAGACTVLKTLTGYRRDSDTDITEAGRE